MVDYQSLYRRYRPLLLVERDAAGPLTAFLLTGHLAQHAGVGKKVEWDVEKMQCTNRPELNKFVRREYRSGWAVKGLS